ncbi:hypothetical protein ACRALDRAFT_1095377 [Sodiomyces alcalophilus JCM 7366]|uniref:uncharacterized protein n=1 Tax=Sodiomyces alcalophilus JCM 7366 TaxID=591952 RepID=UPI0039B69ECB
MTPIDRVGSSTYCAWCKIVSIGQAIIYALIAPSRQFAWIANKLPIGDAPTAISSFNPTSGSELFFSAVRRWLRFSLGSNIQKIKPFSHLDMKLISKLSSLCPIQAAQTRGPSDLHSELADGAAFPNLDRIYVLREVAHAASGMGGLKRCAEYEFPFPRSMRHTSQPADRLSPSYIMTWRIGSQGTSSAFEAVPTFLFRSSLRESQHEIATVFRAFGLFLALWTGLALPRSNIHPTTKLPDLSPNCLDLRRRKPTVLPILLAGGIGRTTTYYRYMNVGKAQVSNSSYSLPPWHAYVCTAGLGVNYCRQRSDEPWPFPLFSGLGVNVPTSTLLPAAYLSNFGLSPCPVTTEPIAVVNAWPLPQQYNGCYRWSASPASASRLLERGMHVSSEESQTRSIRTWNHSLAESGKPLRGAEGGRHAQMSERAGGGGSFATYAVVPRRNALNALSLIRLTLRSYLESMSDMSDMSAVKCQNVKKEPTGPLTWNQSSAMVFYRCQRVVNNPHDSFDAHKGTKENMRLGSLITGFPVFLSWYRWRRPVQR